MVVSGYSRDQELAADAEALRMLYQSGYDTAGLGEFLQTLRSGKGGRGGFNTTHPPAATRIAAVESVIKEHGWWGEPSSARDKRFHKHRLK